MLDANIKQNVRRLMEETRIGCSTRDLGILLRIVKFEIISAKVNISDSSNMFAVNVEYESFKPTIGSSHRGVVNNQFDEGVIVNVNNIQTLVLDARIPIGTYIIVQFTDVMFKDGKYSALGIIENDN